MALKTPQPTIRELADFCLRHLAQNPEQLAEFMMQSGLGPESLRNAMGTHSFAHGLIDYVVSNEPLLLAVAAENKLKPDAIVAVWARHHAWEN